MIGPFDHPWLGGLFGDAEAAAIWSPERQITHMLSFEAAFTRALASVGTVSNQTAEEVASRIEAFQPAMADLRRATARDGVVVPDLVRQIREYIGSDREAVHSGATSQDVIDTALALTLKDFNRLLGTRLVALVSDLNTLAATSGDARLTGRTRMQAAMPIHVRDRLSTWSQPLEEHRARLENCKPDLERLQLGGAAGNRGELGPNANAMASDVAGRLGLGNPPRAWHATRSALVDYAGLLSLISGSLGKMGQDICLMAQQGIDDIALSGGGASSAMPHKQNPVLAELLVTLARFNAAQLSAMHNALIHEQERSGAAWALEWMILPQMAQATARSLSGATEICRSITRIGSGEDS